MKAARELIVNAAVRHLYQRALAHRQQRLFASLLVAFQNQIHCRSVRKFRRAAEAAVLDVEELRDGCDLRFDDNRIKRRTSTGEYFSVRHGLRQRTRGPLQLSAFATVRFGHREKNAPESRAAHMILRRKIRAAKKRTAIGQQKSR